jgi:hypothetical protein
MTVKTLSYEEAGITGFTHKYTLRSTLLTSDVLGGTQEIVLPANSSALFTRVAIFPKLAFKNADSTFDSVLFSLGWDGTAEGLISSTQLYTFTSLRTGKKHGTAGAFAATGPIKAYFTAKEGFALNELTQGEIDIFIGQYDLARL